MTMCKLALLLALFACVGHGRRVQSSGTLAADDDLQKLKKKLEDRKFKKIREMEKRIDEDMQELMSDESVSGWNEDANRVIDEKMKELMAEPKFQPIHEVSMSIDAKMKTMVSDPTFQEFNKQMKLASQGDGKELKALEERPEFQAFQEQSRKIDEEMKAMKALPNFEEFQEKAQLIIDNQMASLKADPKFKKFQEKTKRIDAQVAKMTADPNFKEYQELVKKIMAAEQTEAPQSLAQISQSSGRVKSRSPGRSLAQLLPALHPAVAFNTYQYVLQQWL